MKALHLHSWRTSAEIAVWRHGWAWPLTALVALCAMLAYATVLLPSQKLRDSLSSELAQEATRTPPAFAEASQVRDDERALRVLRTTLKAPGATTSQVRLMAALAQEAQVNLSQATYQYQFDAGIGVTRVQITQPVRATYPHLRRYIEAVLQTMPNVSLDQVTAKRDSVGQSETDARLKWSLWTYSDHRSGAAGEDEKQ